MSTQSQRTESLAERIRHPIFVEYAERRAANIQLRVADAITTFAGSMWFVYIHALLFGIWCGTGLFGADGFPFSFLTMAVSLEAIFLSTFVMIGQNRQSKMAEVKADHDFVAQEQELQKNTELTQQVHELTQQIHAMMSQLSQSKS
jgi:uncharacterized membrane protein